MKNFDYGGSYGYVVDWEQFISHTPCVAVDLYPRPRITRLSLAMLVCGPSLFPKPPEPVLIYKPTKRL